MHRKSQSRNFICLSITMAGAVALLLLLVTVPRLGAESHSAYSPGGSGIAPASAFRLAYPVGHKSKAPPTCFDSGGGLNIIHNFTQKENPSTWQVSVAKDKVGNLYGRASGGDYDYGLIYKLALKNQAWMFTSLYSFTDGYDGFYPSPPIVGPEGAIYGVARGGIQNCTYGYCGVVYNLRPSPTACLTTLCGWEETVLYRFTGNSDAWSPEDLAFDSLGNLYGAAYGGAYGMGTIYELTPSAGGWTEKIIYNFTGGSDGKAPYALVMGNDGNLYGTALEGGDPDCYPPYGCGTVFQLVPSGSGWTFNVIHTFHSSDGIFAGRELVQDSSGNLYGPAIVITSIGGLQEKVFMMSPSNDGWAFTVIWQAPYPYEEIYGLALDDADNLYGVATNTGTGSPLVFEFFKRTHDGQFQGWAQSNLWFPADYGVVVDHQGNFYGTTFECGTDGYGTVWQFTGFSDLSP